MARLGQALAVVREEYELMACFAAYTGLRWGELAALTIGQVNTAARTGALIAMGHPAASLARASGIPPRVVWGIVRGTTATVSQDVHAEVSALYEKTWHLRAPERSAAERRAADAARRRAAMQGWPAPMGLDDEKIDDPAYRPRAQWRPATGAGAVPPIREADPPDGGYRRGDPEQGPALERGVVTARMTGDAASQRRWSWPAGLGSRVPGGDCAACPQTPGGSGTRGVRRCKARRIGRCHSGGI